MSNIDFASLMREAGGGFEPIPDGSYDAQVAAAEALESSTRKTMFKVKFQVLTGPYAGRPVWSNLVISPENPSALGYFFANMAALGLTSDYFAQNPHPTHVADALVGRQCRVEVSSRVYQGQKRNDVKRIMPLNSAVQAPPAPSAPMSAPVAPVPAPAPAPAPVPTVETSAVAAAPAFDPNSVPMPQAPESAVTPTPASIPGPPPMQANSTIPTAVPPVSDQSNGAVPPPPPF